MIPELDRVASPGYLAGLTDKSTDELRHMRFECADLENGVSYVRRLAQGRLDLMTAEQRRRESGAGGDAADLVADLPDLLGGGSRATGSGRMTGDLEPPDEVVIPLTERLDAAVGADSTTGVAEIDDTALQAALAALTRFESQLSEARRSIHSTVDAINEELAQRYRAGETPTSDRQS